jgi:hypothetical protein
MSKGRPWLSALGRALRGGLGEVCIFAGGTVVLALFQWKALTGQTALAHDHLYWGIPIYGFFAERLQLGRLPLWNPFTHGGEPFSIPLFQLRLLDPTAIAVALVGQWFTNDLITLYAWDRLLRGIVIAAGAYLLLRLWARHLLTRLSLVPILLFSSVQWAHVRQMGLAEQFLTAPLVLFFFFRVLYFRDNRWRNWVAAALLFGLNFQTYFFTGVTILLALVLMGLLLFRRRLLRRLWRSPGLPARLAVASAITLVMLIPSIVLLAESKRFVFPARMVDYAYEGREPNGGPPQFEPRSGARQTRPFLFPYGLVLHFGTFSAPNDFVQLVAPFANEHARPSGRPWGKPSEAFMYVGMLGFAVGLLGMIAGRHSLKRVWMLALAALGLLALGPQAFLHAAVYWVFPPLWFVRNTHTLALFFVLALLYFYVLGCNRLLTIRRARLFPASSPMILGPLTRATGLPGLARGLAVLLFMVALVVAVVTASRLRFPLTFYVPPLLVSVWLFAWWLRADLGRLGLYWASLIGFGGGVAILSLRAGDHTSLLFVCVFLALPLAAWACSNSRPGWLPRLAVYVGLGLMALLVGHRLSLLVRGGVHSFGLSPGLVLALAGSVLCAGLLAVVAWDVLRGPPRMLSRDALLVWLGLVLTTDLVAYAGYLRPLTEGERPDRFVAIATVPTPQPVPPSRTVAPSTPPPATYEQTIRYLDLMERRPVAFSPLFTWGTSQAQTQVSLQERPVAFSPSFNPEDSPPPDAEDVAQIQTLLQAERANTFLMTRGYYDVVVSGARGDALVEIFAIARPPIQLRSEWMWLSRTEARALLGDPARATDLPDLLRHTVILEKPPGGTERPAPATGSERNTVDWRWTVNDYDYNSLDLTVEAPGGGVLYWADGYDPYWRAWVDGVEVAVHRANLAFKAIFLPEGHHTVRFEYRPTPIVVSGLLFVTMGFVGAAVAVWALVTPARPPRLSAPEGGLSLTAAQQTR